MTKRLDLKGKTFGRLKVIGLDSIKNGSSYWKCKCECGNIKSIYRGNLTNGYTNSCGCLHKEICRDLLSTHGFCKDPLYSIFYGIQNRCNNPDNDAAEWYFEKGIKCEFKDFPEFKNYVENNLGPRPSKKHSIDRYPNTNGNYAPGNIRWALPKDQILNTNLHSDKDSKYRGVCLVRYVKDRWTAQITVNGIKYHLGSFKIQEEAAEAYLQKYFEFYNKWPPEHRDTPLCYKSPLIYKGLICA